MAFFYNLIYQISKKRCQWNRWSTCLVAPRRSQPSLMRVSLCRCIIYSQFNLFFTYFSFAREDEGSPRQDILAEFCPSQLKEFRTCMTANDFKEDLCLDTKGILEGCSGAAFRKINSDASRAF